MAKLLDVATFVGYGGQTGSANEAQLEAAFQVAESQLGTLLGTPFPVETITGSYLVPMHGVMSLGNTYVHSIVGAQFVSPTGTAEVLLEVGEYVYLVNGVKGLVSIDALKFTKLAEVALLRVTYTAGIDTGTLLDDVRAMLGLTLAAQLVLNEIVARGSGEVEVGVKEYTSMKYTEKRVSLQKTVFGSSATANYIVSLLRHLKKTVGGRM